MAKLAISLATRGRPERLIETINRSIVNWTNTNTVLWVQADEDDKATYAAGEQLIKQYPERIVLDVAPREDTIAAKWNRILRQEPDADVYSVAADDDPYVTRGYDDSILAAAARLPDSIGMVYGWLANLSFSGSISATRRWCEILGYLQPEHFPYWFCDHWTDDLVRITGLVSFSDHRTDQSRVGATQEMREPAWWATFYDACYLARREEARKILEISGEWGRIDRLIANAPLYEQRSFGINQQVRQMQTTPGLDLLDPRYQRVKAKAIKFIKSWLDRMSSIERDYYMYHLKVPTMVQNTLRQA